LKADIRLGRIKGVQIGLHFSWFIIAFLIALSLAAHFRQTNPDWSATTIWILSIATGLLFFCAILVHELSHAIVARSRGLPVKSITLFALGGVAQIEKEATDAKTEFLTAIAGPITSVVVGLFFLLLAWLFGWRVTESPETPLLAMFVWLGYINLSLALFNMIPGFPLDGGRILRAVLWWFNKDPLRSTRIAARIGQAVAAVFIIIGILNFFRGYGLGGIWIAFIGWFLMEAAGSSYMQMQLTQGLQNVTVADIMRQDCPSVDAATPLNTFVDDYILRTGRRCFLVTQDGAALGLITPHEVKEVERDRWHSANVADVMRPFQQLHVVQPKTPAAKALELMARYDVNQLPVLMDGHFTGIIGRSHIMQYLQTRSEIDSS
jgi:Zn-dependent protease/predicted transcriptional regulator